MSENKIKKDFEKFEMALAALEEMAAEPMQKNRGNIDATIHRFEFTIELFLKFLKHLLEEEGRAVQLPKEVLQEAYQARLIDCEQIWLSMLRDRNLTSHTYNAGLADTIYERIKTYVPLLRSTFEKLRKKVG